MTKHETVVIIGAGKIGSALGRLLEDKGEQVIFWDADSSRVPGQRPLSETVPTAKVLFFCVPSVALLDAVQHVLPSLSKKTVIISLEKGIHPEHKETVDMVLKHYLPKGQHFSILGGPMLSDELNRGMYGFGYLGASSGHAAKTVTELFAGTKLLICGVSDPRSIALVGVLKNIYAFLMGIAEGRGLGNNERGYLAGRCIEEMMSLLPVLKGKKSRVALEGLWGDFVATGFSHYSRNHTAGMNFGQSGTLVLEGEGLASLPSITAMLGARAKKFPLLTAIVHVVERPETLPQLFNFTALTR